MNFFKVIKNKKGLSIVEILVAASIFFVLFTAVAATYALGINLQYRSELSTSAELIGQFLLEYFMAADPYQIVTEPSEADVTMVGIISEGTYPRLPNLPYPEGSYEFLDAAGGNSTLNDIYEEAKSKLPPSFIEGRYFLSDLTPDDKYFPAIFKITEIINLPTESDRQNLSKLFPDTIKFIENPDNDDETDIIINSFPPFLIAKSPNLRYRLEVNETTGNDRGSQLYQITINVTWTIDKNNFTYSLTGLVP